MKVSIIIITIIIIIIIIIITIVINSIIYITNILIIVVITNLYADRRVITNDHGLTAFTVFPSELQYFPQILAVPNNAVF